MTPADLLRTVIRPALASLADTLGLPLASPEAECVLLAISIHETGLRTRVQAGGGPGRSFFQLEAGLDALARHRVGGWLATETISAWAGLPRGDYATVPARILRLALGDPELDDLACQLARLILWLDPHPLPDVGDELAAFDCYLRTWRPGVARHAAWSADHAAALAAYRQDVQDSIEALI